MMKNRGLNLRVLFRCAFVLNLCFFMACLENPRDKLLNKQYEMNSFESNTYREGMTVSGTIDQIATEFRRKKGETYMFSLGFRPTTDDIAEFEQILRNDFAGEIEIFREGWPHSVINYHDFESFAWSPGGDTYGPVYYFTVNENDTNHSFKPKIRGKKASTYSFYIQRVRESPDKFGARDGHKRTVARLKQENELINVPAVMRRIDMDMEKKGRYIISLGFYVPMQFTIQNKRAFTREFPIFDSLMENDYDGIIKVYKKGNPYLVIRHDDTKDMWGGNWWGRRGDRHGSETILARGYFFYADEPCIYSFVPEMKSEKEFEFFLSIYYSYPRK